MTRMAGALWRSRSDCYAGGFAPIGTRFQPDPPGDALPPTRLKSLRAALVLAVMSVCSRKISAQSCDATHYRWPAKTSTALLGSRPRPASVRDILTWPAPPIGRGARFRCAPRSAPEAQVVSVVGWVRRVDKRKDDGDWHIELTQERDDPVEACIVAEIPPAELHAAFRDARAALDSALRTVRVKRHGDLPDPVQLRFIGAAFFDGEHLSSKAKIRPHGRCNASVSALWEIHPVYRIERP